MVVCMQRCDWNGGIPGAFTFTTTCLEDLATPFFELWSLPGLVSADASDFDQVQTHSESADNSESNRWVSLVRARS